MLSRKLSIFLTSLTLLFATSASAAPAKILPLGDSITSDGDFAYRDELYKMLDDTGYNFEFVGSCPSTAVASCNTTPSNDENYNGVILRHEGHSGWRAEQVDDSLNGWLQNYDVDVALVHLGTNDIIHKQNNEDTLSELQSIVTKIKAEPNLKKVFIAQLLPLGTDVGNYDTSTNPWTRIQPFPTNLSNDYSSPLNNLIDSGWSNDNKVVIVDQYTDFDLSKMQDDLIHPKPNGEEEMAKRWFDALKAAAVLPPKLTLSSSLATSNGAIFTVTTTPQPSPSAGAITFSTSSVGICAVNPTSGEVTPQAEGTCDITASQEAAAGYAAATSNTVSITITEVDHTVSFANNTPPNNTPLSKTYGDVPFEVEATSKKTATAPTIPESTGLPVTITVRPTSSAICTIDATNKVTILKAGLCKLFAKAGGAVGTGANRVLYKTKTTDPAEDYLINIAKATQTITFGTNVPSSITYGIAPFEVSATSDSTNPKLPVTLGTTTQNVCTYNATTKKLTIKSAGTCTLKAAQQSGDDRYEAAATITTDIVVTTTPQTITFPEIADKTFGTAPFNLNATSSSGLEVSYISTTTNICTVSGNKVTLHKVGHCKIIASAGSSTVSSVTASREFDVIPNAEQNTYDTVIKILNGNGNAATTNTQLKLIGLKKLNPNFDYTQALKKGSYKNKSKDKVIKEMQRIINKENSGNLETAGSSSAAWLLLLGVIALYRRNRFVKNTMSCRNR